MNSSRENFYGLLDDEPVPATQTPKPMTAAPGADPVVEAVRADLLRRSQHGIAKYGRMLDRKDLTLRDWLQHAYEEALDLANYLKRAIVEIDAPSSEIGAND